MLHFEFAEKQVIFLFLGTMISANLKYEGERLAN